MSHATNSKACPARLVSGSIAASVLGASWLCGAQQPVTSDSSTPPSSASASAPVAAGSAAAASPSAPQPRAAASGQGTKKSTPVPAYAPRQDFANGSRLHYGISTNLFRFSVTRRSDEPAARRNYVPGLETIPSDVAFTFLYEPNKAPWRLCNSSGKQFQLLSWGGSLMLDPASRRDQSSLSVALLLGLFDNWIAVGAGVDLYRGVKTLGSDGVAGNGTAYTGLLGWALSPEGEVTPENFFINVALNLSNIIAPLSGQAR